MSLLLEYQSAREVEELARLKRVLALRAMLATGSTQRQVGAALGVSQPAVSQQLKNVPAVCSDPVALVDAGGSILRGVAEDRGFADLAVFGSVARREARRDSDIDLLVRPPAGTTIAEMESLRRVFEEILDHPVDLVSYGGLKPVDDDILREAVLL